jgi:hypothetical protein
MTIDLADVSKGNSVGESFSVNLDCIVVNLRKIMFVELHPGPFRSESEAADASEQV